MQSSSRSNLCQAETEISSKFNLARWFSRIKEMLVTRGPVAKLISLWSSKPTNPSESSVLCLGHNKYGPTAKSQITADSFIRLKHRIPYINCAFSHDFPHTCLGDTCSRISNATGSAFCVKGVCNTAQQKHVPSTGGYHICGSVSLPNVRPPQNKNCCANTDECFNYEHGCVQHILFANSPTKEISTKRQSSRPRVDTNHNRPLVTSSSDSCGSFGDLSSSSLSLSRGSSADRFVGLTIHCLLLSLLVMSTAIARWSLELLRFLIYMALHTAVYRGVISPLREDTDEPITQDQLRDATVFDSTGLKLVLLQYRPPQRRAIEEPKIITSQDMGDTPLVSTTRCSTDTNSSSNNTRTGHSKRSNSGAVGSATSHSRREPRSNPRNPHGQSQTHSSTSMSSKSGSSQDVSQIFSSRSR